MRVNGGMALIAGCVAVLAIGGCDDGSDGGGAPALDGGGGAAGSGGAGGGAAGAGGASRTAGLPQSTGDDDADHFIRAAVACGPQRPESVPAGWQMVSTGELGCTFMAPPGWNVHGAGENITSVGEGAAELAGFVSMAGADATGMITSTPRGVADWAAGLLAQGGPCTDLQQRWYREGLENVAGVAIPKADYVFSCTKQGTGELAYLWASVQGETPVCSVLVFGMWMPAVEIDAKACTLTQILNSFRCPPQRGPLRGGAVQRLVSAQAARLHRWGVPGGRRLPLHPVMPG